MLMRYREERDRVFGVVGEKIEEIKSEIGEDGNNTNVVEKAPEEAWEVLRKRMKEM